MYDLEDPLIVEMIKEGHKPEEIYHWSPATGPEGESTGKRLAHIICERCAVHWPCAPILLLRNRQEMRTTTGQHL